MLSVYVCGVHKVKLLAFSFDLFFVGTQKMSNYLLFYNNKCIRCGHLRYHSVKSHFSTERKPKKATQRLCAWKRLTIIIYWKQKICILIAIDRRRPLWSAVGLVVIWLKCVSFASNIFFLAVDVPTAKSQQEVWYVLMRTVAADRRVVETKRW